MKTSILKTALTLLSASIKADGFAYIDQSAGGIPGKAGRQQQQQQQQITTTIPPGCDPQLLQEHAQFASELADAARLEILPYWRICRSSLGQETKLEEDRSVFQSASPVTLADRAAERVMRALIEERYPSHGIYGEEYGQVRTDADFVWVLDPIDGTRSFITGKPLFGTLISCLYKGTPVIGIIDQCVLDERWVGMAGRVSTLNGNPIKTNGVNTLKDAEMYSTTPDMFKQGDELNKFDAMRDAVKTPHYGADCYAYALVASGFGADIVVEADLGLYDYCAIVPVLQGAGGTISDWNGEKLTLKNHEKSKGRVVASANAMLHAQALEILSKPDSSSESIDDHDPSLDALEGDISSIIFQSTPAWTPWVGGAIVGDLLEQFLHHGP
jgi:inositol-phosphate phosphatase/L-galactose 1-phosphate phosphatase/histidinol-phosphatase